MGALCDRLAKDFAGHAKRLAPTLLEKVRSDKTRVIDALDDCLGRLTKSGALTFDGAVDAAAAFVTAPNPLGRHAALTWIAKAAAHDKPAAVAKKLPELLDLLQPLYEDGAAATRTDALATLVGFLRPLDFPTRSTALAKVPPKKAQLAQQMLDGAARPPPVAARCRRAHRAAADGAGAAGDGTGAAEGGGAEAGGSAEGGAAPKAAAAPKPKAAGGSSKAAAWSEPELPGEPALLEALETSSLFEGGLVEKLGKKEWKERQEACNELATRVKGLGDDKEKDAATAELVLWQLSRAPGAAEKMFQVAVEVLDVISAVAGWPAVGRRSAARLIGWATAQLGAPKTKEAASEALSSCARRASPRGSSPGAHRRHEADESEGAAGGGRVGRRRLPRLRRRRPAARRTGGPRSRRPRAPAGLGARGGGGAAPRAHRRVRRAAAHVAAPRTAKEPRANRSPRRWRRAPRAAAAVAASTATVPPPSSAAPTPPSPPPPPLPAAPPPPPRRSRRTRSRPAAASC